eukprot:m.21407 g.21407  ORF g.21407 m.21407 type:complete len:82 (+) comp7135_c0_seq2:2087-2332(+)
MWYKVKAGSKTKFYSSVALTCVVVVCPNVVNVHWLFQSLNGHLQNCFSCAEVLKTADRFNNDVEGATTRCYSSMASCSFCC